MFRVDYSGTNEKPGIYTDIKDVGDMLISVFNNKKVEQSVINWCSKANFGDSTTFGYNNRKIRISCIYNEGFIKPLSRNDARNLVERFLKGTFVDIISERTNRDGEFIFDIGFGNSEISFSNPTKHIWINMNHSDGNAVDAGIVCRSIEEFLNIGKGYFTSNLARYPFEIHNNIITVANKITDLTGIKHNDLQFDDDDLMIEFVHEYMLLRLRNNCGRAFNFSICNNMTGEFIWEYTSKYTVDFVKNVAKEIKKYNITNKTSSRTVPNREIIQSIMKAAKEGKSYTATILKNDIWELNIERHPYGMIRFWVSREDKAGNYQSSLCTPYMYNGEVNYSAEFKICTTVANKLKTTYKTLWKAGLVE